MKETYRRLLGILAVGAVLIAWAALDGPRARQDRAIKRATSWWNQVEPKVAADPRFASIRLSVSTAPTFIVFGEVPDAKARDDLRAMTMPPADLYTDFRFQVRIAADPGAVLSDAPLEPVGSESKND